MASKPVAQNDVKQEADAPVSQVHTTGPADNRVSGQEDMQMQWKYAMISIGRAELEPPE